MEVTLPILFPLACSQLHWGVRKANAAAPIPQLVLGLPEGCAQALSGDCLLSLGLTPCPSWPCDCSSIHGAGMGLRCPQEAASLTFSLVCLGQPALLVYQAELRDRVRIEHARGQAQVDHRGSLGAFGEGKSTIQVGDKWKSAGPRRASSLDWGGHRDFTHTGCRDQPGCTEVSSLLAPVGW